MARRSRQRTLAKSEDEFPLDRRFGLVVGCHRGFEGLVVFGIFEAGNDGLGGEAMADGIAA